MESLKNLLQINEEQRPNPESNPWDAQAELLKEVKALSEKVDLFFGSAMDVAGSDTLREAAQEINKVRAQVARMTQILEKEIKMVDENINALLSEYR